LQERLISGFDEFQGRARLPREVGQTAADGQVSDGLGA
jgi:hypothetical protein